MNVQDLQLQYCQKSADSYTFQHIKDLICCSSYELLFTDNSFDVVTEMGILHHVAEPERVVAEMLRVAKKAIFIMNLTISIVFSIT